jgi:hypothetical protein
LLVKTLVLAAFDLLFTVISLLHCMMAHRAVYHLSYSVLDARTYAPSDPALHRVLEVIRSGDGQNTISNSDTAIFIEYPIFSLNHPKFILGSNTFHSYHVVILNTSSSV